ncbi:MAG: hypothetical protein HC938_16150 [Nitrospira sp.]|nr:hypothetical protein [Nitrospira sp.]
MLPDSPLFHWVVLPFVIFMARTIDMSLSTLRIVFVAQGRRRLAPLVGFFESLIWLVVVAQALKHLDNPLCVVAYAGRFRHGQTSSDSKSEHRLAMGIRLLRIFPHGDDQPLVEALRAHGQGVTVFDGQGVAGPVKMLFTFGPAPRPAGRARDGEVRRPGGLPLDRRRPPSCPRHLPARRPERQRRLLGAFFLAQDPLKRLVTVIGYPSSL